MSNQFASPLFCQNQIPTRINESIDHITKTFILFDKHLNITGVRDPTNPGFFLLNEIAIYQNGSKEYRSRRMTDAQINDYFYRLENLNTNNSLHLYMNTC